jgi:hypothetical protein
MTADEKHYEGLRVFLPLAFVAAKLLRMLRPNRKPTLQCDNRRGGGSADLFPSGVTTNCKAGVGNSVTTERM